jgi:hypothetical protein
MIARVISKVRRDTRSLSAGLTKSKARRWVVQGRAHLANGAPAEALECARRTLSIDKDYNDAYHLMAEVLMPGENYMTLLSRFHDSLQPEAYVEIGVSRGESLALASSTTRVIGIDPNPRIDQQILSLARIYPIGSNEFFDRYHLLDELGTSRLPLAFIDGLHLFEQVLKDFINVEKYADKRTVVLIHDCLPIARILATRIPATNLWCGDVWKIIPCLIRYRPDLKVGVIPTQPSGLGVVTNLDPNSTVLQNSLKRIVADYSSQTLEYDRIDLVEHSLSTVVPGVVPNDWERITATFSLPVSKTVNEAMPADRGRTTSS